MRLLPLLLLACTSPAEVDVSTPDEEEKDTAADVETDADSDSDSDTDSDADTDSDTDTDTDTDPVYEHLPVLLIDTDGVPVTTSYKIDGSLDLVIEHDGSLTDLDAAPRAFAGPIGIEMHGSSSTGYPKLSFRFEIRDEAGEDLDTDLLDLGSDSDWVLIASYGDKSWVRNALAFSLGRELAEGTDRYEPRHQFVEVYYNGDYYGVYTLTGRIKRDGSRVDIPEPAADADAGDLTGGYIFKLDYGRDPYFTTDRGSIVSWVDPQYDQITSAQAEYLSSHVGAFEEMLFQPDYGSQLDDWIDTDAWIDYMLVQELSHSIDGLRLSTYLYKLPDSDGGRIVAGPLWDFDRAFGNIGECGMYSHEGWIQDGLTDCGHGYQFAPWWEKVRQDPDFADRMRCRWESLREGVLSDEALEARIDGMIEQLQEGVPRDDARWGTIGLQVGFNWYIGETWEDEIDYLKGWLFLRTAWMDENLPGRCG